MFLQIFPPVPGLQQLGVGLGVEGKGLWGWHTLHAAPDRGLGVSPHLKLAASDLAFKPWRISVGFLTRRWWGCCVITVRAEVVSKWSSVKTGCLGGGWLLSILSIAWENGLLFYLCQNTVFRSNGKKSLKGTHFLLYLNQKLSDFLKMKAICVHCRKFGKFFFSSSHLLAPSPKNHS